MHVENGVSVVVGQELPELVLCAQMQAIEMLQAAQEAVRALDLPVDFKRTLSTGFDLILEGL